MDVERESPHGCQNNFNSEENNESDFDYGPSKLGTKEFWEASYKKELETFKDIGDVGEIWFGEESMKRVLRWMDKAKIPENAAILDIGTGNGAFLLEMAKHGYRNLTGVDYSASSVELAKNVLQAEDLTDVTVKEMDFLNCDGKLKGFDVCIDKGTFDAIILNPDNFNDGKKLYIQSLKEALKCDGFFAITSCNWTREQLLDRFSQGELWRSKSFLYSTTITGSNCFIRFSFKPEAHLEYIFGSPPDGNLDIYGFEFVQELPTPRFQFGGKTGNAVTALIFKRVH